MGNQMGATIKVTHQKTSKEFTGISDLVRAYRKETENGFVRLCRAAAVILAVVFTVIMTAVSVPWALNGHLDLDTYSFVSCLAILSIQVLTQNPWEANVKTPGETLIVSLTNLIAMVIALAWTATSIILLVNLL